MNFDLDPKNDPHEHFEDRTSAAATETLDPSHIAPTGPIRVAIVDDQSLVRTGLRLVLDTEDDIDVIAEAEDGQAGIDIVRAHRIDVLLMDVRMPRLNGIEATKIISRQTNAPKILILTTFDLDEYAFAAIHAGASGFLLKDARPAELVSAIRAVHSGDAALSPRVTKRLVELLAERLETDTKTDGLSDEDTDSSEYKSDIDTLTTRETEILVAIGEGLNNSSLAAKFFLSESTVKSHVSKLLSKLNARDRVHLVIIAYEAGLIEP